MQMPFYILSGYATVIGSFPGSRYPYFSYFCTDYEAPFWYILIKRPVYMYAYGHNHRLIRMYTCTDNKDRVHT